jgi:hypothetical protein
METFVVGGLGFKSTITFEGGGVRVSSPGVCEAIPWSALRGFAVTVNRRRFNRTTRLLIGYDTPNAAGRAVMLHVHRAAPELARLSAALRARDPRLWHGETTLIAARRSMGLSNRLIGISAAVSIGLALVVAAVVVAMATSTRASGRETPQRRAHAAAQSR